MIRSQKAVKNPIIHVKPIQRIQDENHVFYDSVHVYWCVFFLMGLVPIRKDKNGDVKIKYLSPCTLYCLFIYSALMYPAINMVKNRMLDLSNPKSTFEDAIFSVLALIMTSTCLLVPWTHWLEFKNIEKVFTRWKNFQIDYRATTGDKLPCVKKRYIIIRFLIICALTTVPIFLVGPMMFDGFSSLEMIVFSYVFFNFQLHFSVWMINAQTISIVMDGFKKNFRKIVIERGKYNLIAKFNALWIDIAELTEAVGGIFYKMQGVLLLSYFCTLTMNGFSIITGVIEEFTTKRIAATVSCMIGALLLLITCKTGNTVSQEVGEYFIDELLDYKSHSQDEEFQTEIEIFIDSIQITPHKISYQGYIRVDNALFVSVLSTVITYLVVVVQFSIS